MKFFSLVVTLLVVYTDVTHGVTNSTIEFLFNLNDRPGDGYRLGWQSPTFPAFARSAKIICVYGMWALYDTEDYGNGSPSTTTTTAVQGTGINDCTTSSVEYIIRNIRSLRPLVADLKPTAPTCAFWPNKNFIGISSPPFGETTPACAPSTTGAIIGSLAYTESQAANYAILQLKSQKCVCVDLTQGPFFISDPNLFPNAQNPIGDIMAIMSPAATCPMSPTICSTITTRTFNNVFRSYHIE